ncbi:MAG: hypothetical protein LBQ40_02050 [Clostridiales bacterium]|nr:hypothetical protein [Clostridiales bacterium]
MRCRVAVASGDGRLVNRHFGRCDRFLIAEIDTQTAETRYIEERRAEPLCGCDGHGDGAVENVYEVLKDCKFVLTERAGLAVKEYFYTRGAVVLEDAAAIEDALIKLIKHVKMTEG